MTPCGWPRGPPAPTSRSPCRPSPEHRTSSRASPHSSTRPRAPSTTSPPSSTASPSRRADLVKAVRFHRYGDIDVLGVEDVEPRPLGPKEVLVRVRAAGINPGEAKIRTGALHEHYPATFPSGQGSDLAGTVVETGTEVTRWQVGDPVFAWSWGRSSHAEYVAVPDDQLVAIPRTSPGRSR